MTRGLLEAEVYVEDLVILKALHIECGEDLDDVFILDHDQSLEAAEMMESIADGRREKPFVIYDSLDSLCIEQGGWKKVRIRMNVSVIVDHQGVREIAHDLRSWTEVEE